MSDNISSVESFIKLVREMRLKQTAYFEHRRESDLRRAKNLEVLVDAWLDARARDDARLAEWKERTLI